MTFDNHNEYIFIHSFKTQKISLFGVLPDFVTIIKCPSPVLLKGCRFNTYWVLLGSEEKMKKMEFASISMNFITYIQQWALWDPGSKSHFNKTQRLNICEVCWFRS